MHALTLKKRSAFTRCLNLFYLGYLDLLRCELAPKLWSDFASAGFSFD